MKPKPILWVSFFLNGASFFFTMRARRALTFFSVFAACAALGYYLLEIEVFPQLVEVLLVIVFLFLPVIINAVVLAVHESDLRHSASSTKEKTLELADNIKDLLT